MKLKPHVTRKAAARQSRGTRWFQIVGAAAILAGALYMAAIIAMNIGISFRFPRFSD
jgi:hypothetical protein